jgi:HTH-type transcriptional regulator / antitoxin HigA
MGGWRPDWGVAPGEVLLETLQERGMTQVELANRMARPLKTINEIIKGKAAITPDTAIQLERTLGISARFWSGLEARYREHLARRAAQQQLEANAGWAEGFPLADLVHYGLIRRGRSKAETLSELLSYFRISGPDAFDRHWLDPAAAFRSSPAFMASPKAVAAWLRWGEIEAAKVDRLPAYHSRRFREVVGEVRVLTRQEPFMQTLQRVQKLCAEAGVIVVLTPEFQGTHLSGATRWVQGRPIIQLSLRHKSDDHFWFTFFHEAGHVLNSPRRRDFVDSADLQAAGVSNGEEAAANRFARDLLIPPEDYAQFLEVGDFSSSAVSAFAKAEGIPDGVVVGRLQRDGKVTPASYLNRLKKPIRWTLA